MKHFKETFCSNIKPEHAPDLKIVEIKDLNISSKGGKENRYLLIFLPPWFTHIFGGSIILLIYCKAGIIKGDRQLVSSIDYYFPSCKFCV